jgi:hypothetical protein
VASFQEIAMATNVSRVLGAAALAGVLAGASAAVAQTKRPWVDPPPEAATQQPADSSAPADEPPDPEHTGSVARAEPSERPAQAARSAQRPRSAQARSARPAQVRQTRRRAEIASARGPRRAAAEQPVDLQTIRTAAQARRAGLELMRLRTIEFPDGRRVDVLTRINP